MKGDTVFIEKFKDRYVYKDRWRDSIRIKEVHDTTLVNKEVEKPLSKYKQAKLDCFWWLICGLFVCLGWIFKNPLLKLIRKFI